MDYLCVAKDAHCAIHDWSTQLAREHKRANAAARRGLGPAHQSATLPLIEVCSLDFNESALCDGAPVGFLDYVVVASMFLLREIEAFSC